MTEITHTIQGDEGADIRIEEELGMGFYLQLEGNGSSIRCYIELEHMQDLVDQLAPWGLTPSCSSEQI